MTLYQALNNEAKQKLQVSFQQLSEISPDRAFDNLKTWLNKTSQRESKTADDNVIEDRRFLAGLTVHVYNEHMQNGDLPSLIKANDVLMCQHQSIPANDIEHLSIIDRFETIADKLITMHTTTSLATLQKILPKHIFAISHFKGGDLTNKAIGEEKLNELKEKSYAVNDALIENNEVESLSLARTFLVNKHGLSDAKERNAIVGKMTTIFDALVTLDTHDATKVAREVLVWKKEWLPKDSPEREGLDERIEALADNKPVSVDIDIFLNNFDPEEYKLKYGHKPQTV